MNTHRLFGWVIPAALVAVFFASCGREPVLDMAKDGRSLMITPSLLDLQENSLKVRALTEDDLKDNLYNENVVSRLDVFFFAGTTLAQVYHITTDAGTVSHGGKTGYLLSDDWAKDGLQMNTAYTVYVVANSTDATVTTATKTSGVTPETLMGRSHADADIYKRYNASTEDDTYTKNKSFLMNAKVDSWTITSSGTQLVNDDKITLERAAVKFVLDVSLSDAFAARLSSVGERYGEPNWKFINFNTVTPEVPGAATAPDAVLATGGSGKYLTVVPGTGDQAGHYTVETYAYPQTWTADNAIDAAPAIFLSFPCDHGEGTSEAYHYYYIPICSQSTTATVRNNLYKVNAVISSYGSTEAISGTEVNLNYAVMPWGASNTASIEAIANDYILATPSIYTFKGGPTDAMLSTQIKYYASGDVTVDTESIYAFYIDKNGDEVEITDLDGLFSIQRTSTGSSGYFTVSSLVPTNGTYREVHFTVTCGSKSQVVKIRHYPLDFITAEDGAYSSYNYDGWAVPEEDKSFAAANVVGSRFVFSESSLSDWEGNDYGIFNSHIFDEGKVKVLNADGTVGSQVNTNPLTNNQMYILQITSANDAYTIGRPSLTIKYETVYTYSNYWEELESIPYKTSNDNVISPAFILGSQLGAVGIVSSAKFAAMHCSLYKEYDGKTTWTGWRLPTKQEVKYMIDNQNTYGDVMAEVVGGRYYWTLDGGYVYNEDADGTGDNSSENGSKYVRCVRDLSETELKEINKFE